MPHSLKTRREFLQAAAAVGGLAVTHSLIGVTPAMTQSPAKVGMQLGWLASNGILGEVVAIKKGFYAEEGVELEITPGGPNIDGVGGVAAGQRTLGQTSSSPSVMLARSAGIPIKAFAAGYQKHPFTYFSLENAAIREPKDMIGKTIATQPTAFILLRALLAKNGIAEDQVTVVNMGSDMNQLITGQAQAVTGWLTNTNALKVLGADRVDMMLWDTGIQLYANVYFATDKTLTETPDVLEKFVRGSARGWGYAKEHPEEAVEILVETYPNLDKASELDAVGPVLDFSFRDTTKEHGWGGMTRENWTAQVDTYASLDQFKGAVPTVDDVMTLAILEATADIRKKVG
ncbi:ABC transporter substrate-binding protein [Allomesorhizobium camelthorni]|uniref:Thiamine pyrimidine synthase n=1 Tax=Allomesorhizobium camelthorni TaxID=475069 RepID=A0A6G4WJB6_9HYPH|nr:ABC transporter substrate-binding protein [Mesorhizobium camelthorni]NGO54699.1 ABC transporter substrate-binding protein [Mesorhizobium camelthorni]